MGYNPYAGKLLKHNLKRCLNFNHCVLTDSKRIGITETGTV